MIKKMIGGNKTMSVNAAVPRKPFLITTHALEVSSVM